MSTSEPQPFLLLLLLIPFSAVVICIVIYFARAPLRRRHLTELDDISTSLGFAQGGKGLRSPFDQPSRWLAVRSHDIGAVQNALGLIRPTPCSWEEGINEAGEHKLFISSPINGWILVVGAGLPEPAEDVDKCYLFLMELSRKLGHLQYFSFNRVLNHHAWALIERGCVFRGYAWAGRTLWNQGPLTAAERDVGMVCFGYLADPSDSALQEAWTLNTEKVGRLAGWWSIDPSTISERTWLARQGIVGDLSHSRQH